MLEAGVPRVKTELGTRHPEHLSQEDAEVENNWTETREEEVGTDDR